MKNLSVFVLIVLLSSCISTIPVFTPRETNREFVEITPEPVVEGSDIYISKVYKTESYTLYKTNDHREIFNDELNNLRKVMKTFNLDPAIATLLLDKKIEIDEVENRAFISPKLQPGDWSTSRAYLYIGINKANTWLRFHIIYHGKNWLFANSYKIAADEYRWQSPRIDFKRDNSTTVWEWHDSPVTEPVLDFCSKLIESETSIIRFQGEKGYYDLNMTAEQKQDMKEILALFDTMKNTI